MKRQFLVVIGTLAVAGPVMAQHQEHEQHEGHGMGKMMMETPWREMNGFHSLLHLSHQPLMKSGDLAPAKRNAGALADAAEAWAKSTAPVECKAPADIAEKLAVLAGDVRTYAALVHANGSDEEVKAGLGKIHDQFKAAHMACMPMGMGKGMKGMDHKKPPA